jgi:hypothetical protein
VSVPIRVSAANPVPSCVTPERLMAFLGERNDSLDPRFKDIARWYRSHGERLSVRWDYAFFQMVIETNYLTFLRPSGQRGDVDPRQNNFAGIGTTGGGVPGDSYPDVATGVLAQIQHLVVYSGERLPAPVAPRTRLKQDDILKASIPIAARRPVTFQDLAGRWAVDRAYGRSIEAIAERFRARHCTGALVARARPAPVAARVAVAAPPPDGPSTSPTGQAVASPSEAPSARFPADPHRCRVLTASYGGTRSVLIRRETYGTSELFALRVQAGFERSMTEAFIRGRAPGGVAVGEPGGRDEALARALTLCPGSGVRAADGG